MSGSLHRIGVLSLSGTLLAWGCGGGGGAPSAPTPMATPAPTPEPTPTPEPIASYRVAFDATWSRTTHPVDFPPNPHFSPLIGGTHSDAVQLWAPGAMASEGIKAMAERGNPGPLAGEVETAIAAGTARQVLLGEGIASSPGSEGLELQSTVEFPLVTLTSMVAPSPDWFVGVHDLPLLVGGAWVEQQVVTLYVYDAGTDSGATYQSRDRESVPREPIARIDGFPLEAGGEVRLAGTFTFTRVE